MFHPRRIPWHCARDSGDSKPSKHACLLSIMSKTGRLRRTIKTETSTNGEVKNKNGEVKNKNEISMRNPWTSVGMFSPLKSGISRVRVYKRSERLRKSDIEVSKGLKL